ncbi:hypothetical protein MKX01_012967 [Papaver californicum]|nr:hypothetical protein MKX01_012967 [Papaver californicum]
MGRSSKKSDVVAAAASPDVKSVNKRGNKRDAEEEIEINSYARNLPFSINKSDLTDFFKQAGEVVDARYGNYKGTCHIEFATEEAAKKALELDGQNLCNREIGVDRYGSRTTGASKTLIAKNLSFSITKSDVINFFKRAGEIIDVRFSLHDNGDFRGHCHIEFATEEEEGS